MILNIKRKKSCATMNRLKAKSQSEIINYKLQLNVRRKLGGIINKVYEQLWVTDY